MNRVSQFLRFILRAMFSQYNGLQVFLSPGTIFYWISSSSILWAFTSLVSLRIHLLPLTFFGVLLIYVGFMVLKIYTCIFPGPHKNYPNNMSDFYDSVIQLHVVLFITIMILMVFYVLTMFLSYFYAIKLSLKQGVMFIFRAYTILLILYYYLKAQWLKPLRGRNYSKRRSELLCYSWIYRHPWTAMKYSLMVIVVVFASVKAYELAISCFISPLLSYLSMLLGFRPYVELMQVQGIGSVFYNVFMLSAAFMLSNLLFYPLIVLGQSINNRYHPMKIKQVNSVEN